jgi:hypothetical protein
MTKHAHKHGSICMSHWIPMLQGTTLEMALALNVCVHIP